MIGIKDKNDEVQAFWSRATLVIGAAIVLISASFFLGSIFNGSGSWLRDLGQGGRLFFGNPSSSAKAEKPKDFQDKLFYEVWNTLKDNYVDGDKLQNQDMFYGALEGMAAATGDPYTVFMTPSSTKSFEQDMAGSFEGIGAEIGLKNNIITIVAPLEDMPAAKAGLRAGDKIIKINGELTVGFSTTEAVGKIRGPKGTSVTLTISREGRKDLFDVVVKRATIQVKSVKTSFKDGIATIRVTNFNDDTDALFAQAVNEIIKQKPKGIILDLRNNPGGYLSGAIQMASFWLSDSVVVSEKYADGHIESHRSVGNPTLAAFRTVVLINEGSASASEIVAGALQDTGLAVLVGQKSFGKGSVQIIKTFSDGSSLKVTTAKWLTPKGRSIDKEGIMPEVKVVNTPADVDKGADPQMDKAISIIKKK